VDALGLYSRAASVVFVPLRGAMESFGVVANPTLARLQGEPGRFRLYYVQAVRLQTLLLVPSLAFLAVAAPDATRLLLGPQWDGVGAIARALCLAAVPMPLAETHRWISLAFGRGARVVRVSAAAGVWLLSCLAVGVRFGPIGVASGYAVGLWVVAPMALLYATRDTPIALGDVGRALAPGVAVALCVAITAALVRAELPATWPLVVRFAASGVASGALGLCAASALSGHANPLRWLRESLAGLRSGR
jgi:PST family polysaccharide transporter